MKPKTNCTWRVFARLLFSISIISICSDGFAGEGAVDTTFNVVANNPVYSTLVQPNGRILIGGAFNTINGVQRYGFARLFPDGSLDTSISNVISGGGTVYAMLVQPDGKFVLAGNFQVFGQTTTHFDIVRLNVDGSVDGTFTNSVPSGQSIFAVALQTDGKILIGGTMQQVGGTNHNLIARLNTDGTVDNSFNAGTISGNMVNAIAVQNDGNILMGGSFSQFVTYGLTRLNIARLTTNGTPDISYTGSASSTAQSVFLEPSGKSVWAGAFTSLDNFSRSRVGRLNTDGSLDGTFGAIQGQGAAGTLYDVVEDTNANIYVGGQFSTYNGLPRIGVARLFSDGTMDTNFNITTNFPPVPLVRCVALQPDGKVIVGGSFTTWTGFGRTNLVRLYGNNYPAEIVTQPRSTNVAVGANVTFSVDVSNPTPVDYQWFYNGSAIPGATDNEYSVFNAQLDDSGTFSVFVNSSLGGTMSSNAVLQV
ncbi:MAG TPA: immunoglobulin domain-containing protein, partial [Verrucomicrobiae bacterium]|nr:immunoglobulin domain-containing protein [Verrucomicrobiae bacterium]